MPKKIPTLLAIILLILTIGGISVFMSRTSSPQTNASSTHEPKNLMVTTVTDTSCKIIWQTDTPATGMVVVKRNNDADINAYDERDAQGKLNKYKTHSVVVKNLQPSTSYNFSIVSGGTKFPTKDPLYTLQTGPSITNISSAGFEPAYGTIKTDQGQPAYGGIVVLSLADSQPLSTLITQSGSWIIPLNAIRKKDLSAYLSAEDTVMETISVYYETEKTESITDTVNDSPVPDMTVGSSYDFRNQSKAKSAQLTADTTAANQASVLGAQTASPTATITTTPKYTAVAITKPEADASLVSVRPLIQGTGIPGKTISITLGIQKPISAKTTVGTNGVWSYTPTQALTPGKQSVTITTVDAAGKPIALTTAFTILKSGTQVLGDATPSATLTPTETPIASITAQPLPEPGTWELTAVLVLLGIGLVAGGIVLLR